MTEVHKNPSSADNPQDNKMLERLSGDDAFEALRRRFVESQEGKTRLQEENLRLQQEVVSKLDYKFYYKLDYDHQHIDQCSKELESSIKQ